MADLVKQALLLVAPQPCFDEFFVNFNFFDVPCLKVAISKCLGYAIILGSILVKLPQVIKLFRSKSSAGLSFSSLILELLAITISLTYSYQMSFPFSAYGESIFLAIQSVLIMYLVLVYRDNLAGGVALIATYLTVLAFLTSPYAPMELLAAMSAGNIFIVLASRALQIMDNLKNKSTGQLSVITWFLLVAGAAARIFTSIQETGDVLVIVTYVVNTACNALVFFQILYYGEGKRAKAE